MVIGLHKHIQRLKDSLLSILGPDGKPRDQYAHCERKLWKMLSPTMRVAADSAMQHNPECAHWMVCLHLSMADDHKGRLRTTIYVQPLALSMDRSVAVAILGPPRAEMPARSIPAAKGSQWASDRMVHERHLPEGTTEGILCNSSNALLEGLITNVFVVREVEGQFLLQTAHPSQGILDGVCRRLIIQACGEAGVKCLEDAPLWEQRHAWVQAFTCNSVAGVRMISSMRQLHKHMA
ncbi:g1295 [Coccomyxa viridis]|uniref:G1295 protein n=1 Tax=Coccomyxa viridis TaxID=1274662 RepID=A0ABP1FHN8_9CHLO